MADRWFRVPETGSGAVDDPIRPDLFGYDVEFSANKSHANGAPIFVIRVFSDSETLDKLASEPGATELPDVPVTALNNMFGQDRTAETWNQAFAVGP